MPDAPAVPPPPDGLPVEMRFRVGRKVGRTIYRQVGPEPSDSDELVAVMDTRELAALAVAGMNRGECCSYHGVHDGCAAFRLAAESQVAIEQRRTDLAGREAAMYGEPCPECAEQGHADCYRAGRRSGREDAARDADFWFRVAVNTATRAGMLCPRCHDRFAVHWPDDERGKPGCHAAGCLCSYSPEEILLHVADQVRHLDAGPPDLTRVLAAVDAIAALPARVVVYDGRWQTVVPYFDVESYVIEARRALVGLPPLPDLRRG